MAMQSASEVIVFCVTTARKMGRRFTEDLSPQEYLHRPTPKANCTAWLLGHLVLANRRAAQLLGAADLAALPDGFEKRFARDDMAPGASDFGDVAQQLPSFEKSCDELIAATKRATAEQLDKPLEQPRPMAATVGEFATFMAMHAIMHVGQITIIRRSLGRPPLI